MEEPESRGEVLHKTSRFDLSAWMFYIMVFLAVSLPLSEFGMSVSQFLLFFIWIAEGADFSRIESKTGKFRSILNAIGENMAGKFRSAGSNYLLLAFISIYFLHLVGLIYSTDLQYGLKDIRVKLPLLSIPVLLATSTSLSKKRLNILLLFFIMAVIAGSIISTFVYLTRNISDTREISLFISHIRFSLFISLSIFILFGFIRYNAFNNTKFNYAFAVAAIWLLIFLFILKSFTGILITALLFVAFTFILILKSKKLVITTAIAGVLLVAAGWFYLDGIYKSITQVNQVEISKLDKFTRHGNPYTHDTTGYGIEKGTYVGLYISQKELREAWNQKSGIDFDSLDKKGQLIKYTLIRYMHTKGLRKDADGISQLNADDISQIENGIADAGSMNTLSLRPYLKQMLIGFKEYKDNRNPNGSSLMQRIEYWKTSAYLIEKKPFAGYGTGDVAKSFARAYEETNSPLLPEYRHRSHNQFLAITIALGFIGLIVFLFSIIYPPVKCGKFNNYYYLIFVIIVFISFLTEDTLETQAGATFYAFFGSLFLFGIKKEADEQARVLSKKP